MRIGIIDGDLLERRNHRFPNLATMKISGFYKKGGNQVELLLDYKTISDFDRVYISKFFSESDETGVFTEEIEKNQMFFMVARAFFMIKHSPFPMRLNIKCQTIIYMIIGWKNKRRGMYL